MPLSKQKVTDLISLIKKTYPGWINFSDPAYIKDEIEYKRDAISKTSKLLNEAELNKLIDENKFDDIISRLKIIGHATNLLWTTVPSSGDLAILENDKLEKPAFSRQIFQLLYGSGPSQDRFEKFINFVKDNGLPNKWTFPTYFLFLCHPDTEMFIKPRSTKLIFEYLGVEDLGFSDTPSGETYATIKQLSHQLKDALKDYEPHDMVDIQSLIFIYYDNIKNAVISPEKRSEFLNLFKEFVSTYLLLPQGERHSAYYEYGREQAYKNFEDIKAALVRGEDIEKLTDQILLKLLPYSDTASNRDQGYWISIAPAFSGDLRIKFEAAGWRKEGWPEVASMILNFVRRCDEHPDQISEACTEFSQSPYSKGFQTGTLTPILNALRPDKFVLINKKSRRVLNYFTDKSYTQSLIEYPKANSTALSLIDDVEEDIQILSNKNLLSVDLFDEFSHWLIAIKDYLPDGTEYWKIAPGENGWNWDACREGGFIAIGWDEIGDLSTLNRSQFNDKINELLKEHPDWTKVGTEQVWKFAHIKVGDKIVANKGTAEVLGIGTVMGPYFFVQGARHGHRLPVEWADLTPRGIKEEGWRRTLIKLDRSQFEKIQKAPPIIKVHPPNPDYPLEKWSKETGFDESTLKRWVRAIERKGQAIIYGPPGTGKTYMAERFAKHLISGGDGLTDLVQFHPAYAYEDFIQGIRPQSRDDGNLYYPLVDGRFLEFCDKAKSRNNLCVLIIDEINRANLARVFGELMYLLEYRDQEVPLSGGRTLKIPPNVRIIGTMNTADRSIALVDHALRRRFAFLPLYPDYDVLRRYHSRIETRFPVDRLIQILQRLNSQIGDRHYEVGISFFLKDDLEEHIEDIWMMEILPYLEEYFFDQPGKLTEFSWESVKEKLAL